MRKPDDNARKSQAERLLRGQHKDDTNLVSLANKVVDGVDAYKKLKAKTLKAKGKKEAVMEKAKAFITFPGMGVPKRDYTVGYRDPKYTEGAIDRVAGQKVNQEETRGVVANVERGSQKTPYNRRMFTGGLNPNLKGGQAANFGTQRHEEQHGIFARIGEEHGSNTRYALSRHLINSIPKAHKRAFRTLVDMAPSVKGAHPKMKNEERVTFLHSYLNSPVYRKQVQNYWQNRGVDPRMVDKNIKTVHKHIRNTAANLKLEHFKKSIFETPKVKEAKRTRKQTEKRLYGHNSNESDSKRLGKIKKGQGYLGPKKIGEVTEYLIGGFADGHPSKEFNQKELKMGIAVEMEHTNDPKVAEEIARDHLIEIPDYYTRLHAMEGGAKKDGKFNYIKKLKRNKKIQKGAMHRLAPFNPEKDQTSRQKDKVADFQEEGISVIPRMKGSALKRALHKLHGRTQTRRNKKTGEREFLLHRGVTSDESKSNWGYHPGQEPSGDIHHYPVKHSTSWTTDHKVAHAFATNNQNFTGFPSSASDGQVLSSWIPESRIHHAPSQMGRVERSGPSKISGEMRRRRLGPNSFAHEKEVVVLPHRMQVKLTQASRKLSEEASKEKRRVEYGNVKANYKKQLNKSDNNEVDFLHNHLATRQRGKPESAMLDLAHSHAGVLSYAAEHIGDLTHRISERHAKNSGGYENVRPKVDQALELLTQPYGFLKEHKENVLAGAKYKNIDPKQYHENVRNLRTAYGNAHRELPAFNEVQQLSRDTAVHLGTPGKLNSAIANLRKLKSYLDEGKEAWGKRARTLDPDKVKEYNKLMVNSKKQLHKSEDNYIHLEHYSDKQSDVIDPKFHGKGVSGNERKRKEGPNWVDRSYHYEAGSKPEASLGSKRFKHISQVPAHKIYDTGKDPKGFTRNAYDKQGFESKNVVEERIKNAGYLGYRHSGSDMKNAVSLFHPIKPHTVVDKNIKKASPIRKYVFPGTSSKIGHGWISPKGYFHDIDDANGHGDFHTSKVKNGVMIDVKPDYMNGWISVGHGGGANFRIHSSVLKQPNHPAMKTAREMAGDATNELIINNDKVHPGHFSQHGRIVTEGSPSFYRSDTPHISDTLIKRERYNESKSYSIISGEKPRAKVTAKKPLEQHLKQSGYKYHPLKGKYGGQNEKSYIVYNAKPKHIEQLGAKHGQESVIHSNKGQHKMVFTSGKNKGQHHKGSGITFHKKPPKDNYSTSPDNKTHFTLNFDFGKLHKSEPLKKNDTVQKEIKWKGITIAIEWPKGSIRQYGKMYRRKMRCHYGYFKGIMGDDGEELDVYVGGYLSNSRIFLISQLKRQDKKYDEEKIMIGFKSAKEAVDMYSFHMEDAMFGDIKEISLKDLKKRFSKRVSANFDPLTKEVFEGGNHRMHGWISPKGDFHKLHNKQGHINWIANHHNDNSPSGLRGYYRKGWVSIGHGGYENVAGHPDVLNNPNNPATITSRNLVRDHAKKEEISVNHLGGEIDQSFNVPVHHYVKGRTKKPSVNELFRSENGKVDCMDKGFKQTAAALGAAATMMVPGAAQSPTKGVTTPIRQVQANVEEIKPSRALNRPSNNHNDFLEGIAHIESSDGKNVNHRPMTTGLHSGTSAYGKYGLMPKTLQDIGRWSDRKDVKVLNNMDVSKIPGYLQKNPKVEYAAAHKYADILHNKFNGDKSLMAYAWLNGPNTGIKPEKAKTHRYVKRFFRHYNKMVTMKSELKILHQKAEKLSKMLDNPKLAQK